MTILRGIDDTPKKISAFDADPLNQVGRSYVAPGTSATTQTVAPQVVPDTNWIGNMGGLSNVGSGGATGAPNTDWIGNPNLSHVGKTPVATKENPVIDITPESGDSGFTFETFPEIDELDNNSLQAYIDQANLRQMQGKQPTEREQAMLMYATRKLVGGTKAEMLNNPYDDWIKTADDYKKRREIYLRKQTKSLLREEESLAGKEYERRATEARRQGENLIEQTKSALSFSGFGRSTYAAEQQGEVQRQVDQSINLFGAERDARINRYKAAREGADQETLNAMDENIMFLQQKGADYQVKIVEAMNKYNAENTASYQEKVGNILQLAQQFGGTDEPLTNAEMVMADTYANLVIDSQGNIDQDMLSQVPLKMMGLVLTKASELRGGGATVDQSKFKWQEADDGSFYRTNPETGELETSQTQPSDFDSSGGGWGTNPPEGGYRTDRHNNPTALMWTGGVAEFFKERGYDVKKGDAFPDNPNNFTIDMTNVDDPIQATIDYIDAYGFTYSGGNRWDYISIPDEEWDGFTDLEKAAVIREMYKVEEGDGSIFGEAAQQTPLSPVAQMVIDGELKVSQIKDNTGSDREAQQVMQEISAYREAHKGEAVEANAVNIDKIDELLDMSRLAQRASGGTLFQFFSGEAAKFATLHNQIASIVTMETFLEAKNRGATFGAMSQGEWDILQSSATNLQRQLSREEYQKELNTIKMVMQGKSEDEIMVMRDNFSANYGKKDVTDTNASNDMGAGNLAPTPEEQAFIDSL